jgi:hypothetical protein
MDCFRRFLTDKGHSSVHDDGRVPDIGSSYSESDARKAPRVAARCPRDAAVDLRVRGAH